MTAIRFIGHVRKGQIEVDVELRGDNVSDVPLILNLDQWDQLRDDTNRDALKNWVGVIAHDTIVKAEKHG